jgi:hypothetical protein
MQEQGLFDRSSLSDQIAVLALYLPIIRQDLFDFVRLWNAHSIRAQRKRPGVVSGKPYLLYHHPSEGVQDYGLAFNEEKYREIREVVEDWDLNAILPPETHKWCQDFFASIGFSPDQITLETEIHRTSPLVEIYQKLKSALDIHIQSQQQPLLSLLQSPTGVYNWQRGNQEEVVRQVDLETDSTIPV